MIQQHTLEVEGVTLAEMKGEIERESTYEAERPTATVGGGKSVVVPIDLGSLPRSGRLRVTFEFTIDVVDAPAKPRKHQNTHMRDLDPIT